MQSTRTVISKRSYAVLPSSRSALSVNVSKDQPTVAPLAVKKVTKHGSGAVIATIDSHGPASRVVVALKGGSRFEPKNAPGVAHILGDFAFKDTGDGTGLRTIRESEFMGNQLYSSVGREYVLYGADFLRDNLVDVVPTLLSQVHNPLYQHHEFNDVKSQAAKEGSSADTQTAVFDALHKVAFRGGLANPVLANPALSGSVKRSDLEAYAKSITGAGSNIAIVATGVDHADLEGLVDAILSKVPGGSGSAASDKSSYRGGEIRIDASGPSHYIVAGQGIGYTSSDYPAALVLKGLLGSGLEPAVKWGQSGAPVGKANGSGAKVGAFNISYSDTGVFGMHATGSPAGIKSSIEKAVSALKSAASGISAADLERGKKAAVVALEKLSLAELAQQALATGNVLSASELASKIEGVTADQVSKLASQIAKSPASVVAYGNTRELPYLDEMKL